MLRQRPKGKAVDMPLHDGIEAAKIYALLPEGAQQNLMRMDAVENLEGMIADYTDPEKLIQNKPSALPMVFYAGKSLLLLALC